MTLQGGYQFDWTVVFDNWSQLVVGALIDLRAASIGFGIGCCIGLALAVLKLSGVRAAAVLSNIYIAAVSGCPAYVLLLWLYFGLADALSLRFTSLQAVTIGISLIAGAYTAEVFRAAILAVDRGQVEAARSLGLSQTRTLVSIVLPQAVRIAVAPLGNIYIMVLKGATIMSVIAGPDMVLVASNLNSLYFRPFETYAAVAALLIVIVLAISAGLAVVERALRLP